MGGWLPASRGTVDDLGAPEIETLKIGCQRGSPRENLATSV
jgi:hypothetical protein